MYGSHYFLGKRSIQQLASLLRHPKSASQQRLRCGGAKAYDEFRLNKLHLGMEPGQTCGDFGGIRFRMNPAFAPRLPFEVLHHVRHVGGITIDAGLFESFVEQPTRRSDKRLAREILVIARLFAHQHDRGVPLALAKNRLSGAFP